MYNHYATGKRKNAVARVWLKPGDGAIVVNGKSPLEYFKREVLEMNITLPFKHTGKTGECSVVATVKGGGLSAQADALRHGITKAILKLDGEQRAVLKKAGFITRDPRVKERKKYGLAGARKKFQFSKR